MADSSLLQRLQKEDPKSWWHAVTLAKANQEGSNLSTVQHEDGSITVQCKVCNCSETWSPTEWFEDVLMVHHTPNCLLMTPVTSETRH